ncbi:thioredoxin family protein [Sulfurimonas sp.]|uniref:thioredoxin family protein n=1 Tax=Sulfurimonas sp. TaxID=2022749 RepID=UPI0035691DFF
MKSIILIILMTLTVSASENIKWIKTYTEAVKLSKKQKKPMLLFMNREDCGACEFMKENVFIDEMIYSYINENYIPVYVNIHKNDAPKKMQVKMTPVFHFVRDDNSLIQESLIGGKTGLFFLKILKAGVTEY